MTVQPRSTAPVLSPAHRTWWENEQTVRAALNARSRTRHAPDTLTRQMVRMTAWIDGPTDGARALVRALGEGARTRSDRIATASDTAAALLSVSAQALGAPRADPVHIDPAGPWPAACEPARFQCASAGPARRFCSSRMAYHETPRRRPPVPPLIERNWESLETFVVRTAHDAAVRWAERLKKDIPMVVVREPNWGRADAPANWRSGSLLALSASDVHNILRPPAPRYGVMFMGCAWNDDLRPALEVVFTETLSRYAHADSAVGDAAVKALLVAAIEHMDLRRVPTLPWPPSLERLLEHDRAVNAWKKADSRSEGAREIEARITALRHTMLDVLATEPIVPSLQEMADVLANELAHALGRSWDTIAALEAGRSPSALLVAAPRASASPSTPSGTDIPPPAVAAVGRAGLRR